MNILRSRLLALVSAMACFWIAGCGGGASDGVATASAPVVPDLGLPLSISASNYESAAVEALQGADGIVAQASGRAPLAALVTNAFRCALSTGLEVTLGAGSSGQLDQAGENANLLFRACSFGGVTIDGRLTMVLNAALTGSPTSGVYSADATLLLDRLTLDDGRVRVEASGTLRIRTSRLVPLTGADRLDAAALALTVTPAGGAARTYVLHDFVAALDVSPSLTLASYSGNLTTSALGERSVQVLTPTPLMLLAGAIHPRAGVLEVLGSGGSQATLTVLGATQVRLDLDTNGDGTVDATVTRDWASLL